MARSTSSLRLTCYGNTQMASQSCDSATSSLNVFSPAIRNEMWSHLAAPYATSGWGIPVRLARESADFRNELVIELQSRMPNMALGRFTLKQPLAVAVWSLRE